MNYQLVGSVAPSARLKCPADTPTTVKVWKSQETAVSLTLIVNQHAMLLRTSRPIMPGRGIDYGNFQWDIPLGGVSYFTSLGERGLTPSPLDPIVLPQAEPVEIDYTWNGTHTIERRCVLVWQILPPAFLLTSNRAASL